jgi:hypothetical protein
MWCPVGNMSGLYAGIGGDVTLFIPGLNFKLGIMMMMFDGMIRAAAFSASPARRVL